MVAVVVPVKVGTQRRLSEVEEAVDSEQTGGGMFLGGGDKITGGGDARTIF